ncbi:Serine/threonine-protein kinase EDR1 [Symbiodinium microadriaticum]|uniref:Serine/threonine-protein kinase EDR1 n=1 Tax=Symbiodinium microadriaticum TaxID=2951 RepID=A0A1Q9F560_SYMMI|nr:Serine/threonine-protein kinase EDR1 [Symbiodinium microadriaticum]
MCVLCCVPLPHLEISSVIIVVTVTIIVIFVVMVFDTITCITIVMVEDLTDRIDDAALNTALFFTVKPSELRILTALGAGAHANVYKAEWTRTFAAGTSSIIVAVKQMHTDLGEVYRNRERLTMLTEHPNLVKCVDSTLEPPYLIITEFLAGGSLFDLLYNSDQELSLWQQVKILLDVASGMNCKTGL